MAYCTDADINALVDGNSYLQRGQEADFSAQIAVADAWVDGWLKAGGLELPLGTVPELVRWAAANYCCYLLTRRPNSAGQFTDQMDAFRQEAYKQRDDFLAGKASIPPTPTSNPRVYSPGAAVFNPHAEVQ